jgi:hypothetical protein
VTINDQYSDIKVEPTNMLAFKFQELARKLSELY